MLNRMIVDNIRIKNFRSIKEETFNLKDCTILIGKNNCGKSNILDALRLLFEGTNKDFTDDDYWGKDKDIEIEAEISGVEPFLELSAEKHRSKIQNCLMNGNIRIRKGTNTDGKMQIFEPDKKEYGIPTGIDPAFKQFLPEIITLKSLSDVKSEVKGKSTDAVGKILKLISNEIEDQVNPELNGAYKKVNSMLNIIEETDDRISIIKEIEKLITNYLSELFKNVSTRLKVTFPSASDILGNIGIDVYDGVWTPYFRKGQGLQRGLYLSLFRSYAELVRNRTEEKIKRPIFLIFEEPEAFLHPQLQEEMRRLILEISEKNQILLSTHSPLLISPKTIDQVLRIHQCIQDSEDKLQTTICSQQIEQSDFPSANKLISFLNLERSSRIFFADKVLLVEGISDRYLYRAICEKLEFGAPEDNNFEIVECDSKDNLCAFKKIIEKMGIEVKIIVDDDFLIRGAGEFCSEFEYHEIKGDISKLNQKLDEQVKPIIPNNDKEKEKEKEEKRRILSDDDDEKTIELKNNCIENFKKHSIFILSKGQIEDYVGLGKNSKSLFLKAAKEILEGNREINYKDEMKDIFRQIFNKYT